MRTINGFKIYTTSSTPWIHRWVGSLNIDKNRAWMERVK
jgi:hypothetical protein